MIARSGDRKKKQKHLENEKKGGKKIKAKWGIFSSQLSFTTGTLFWCSISHRCKRREVHWFQRGPLRQLGPLRLALDPLIFSSFPFFFFFFFSVLKRVMLARCFSHYSGSGCRPSMIALHSLSFSLCLSGSHVRCLSSWLTYKHTHTHTHTGERAVYLNELGDTGSVSQQINQRTNWHICHRRVCL